MTLTRSLLGANPRTQKTTTNHLGGINPAWFTGPIINPKTGRKLAGVPFGHYATFPTGELQRRGVAGKEGYHFGRGEIYYHDVREFMRAGLCDNLNTAVLGDINHQKSGGLKVRIIRGTKVGERFMAIDPKGEYGPLTDKIPGAKRFKFDRDSKISLNAMDPTLDLETTRLPLIKSLGLIAMDDLTRAKMNVEEHRLVWEAMQDAIRFCGVRSNGLPTSVPILPMVVEKLFHPTEAMAKGMHVTLDDLALGTEYGRYRNRLALALDRYVTGDMRGMFHGETSPGLFTSAPFVVMDCENLEDEHQAAVVVILNFLSGNKLSKQGSTRQFDEVINDETWKLSKNPQFVMGLIEGLKLGRTRDIAYTFVFHHLMDAIRIAGEAIRGLIADCEHIWLYGQNEAEMNASASELRVDDPSLKQLISNFEPGVALRRSGKTLPPFVIKNHATAEELPLLETSHGAMGVKAA